MFGMTDLVEYCLKKNCKIDMVTTEGPKYHRRFGEFPNQMTPLGYACAEGHVDIVDLLLDHKAPFEEDKAHSAVLWIAAYQGHAPVVDLVLRRFKESHGAEKTAKFLLQRPSPKSGHPILFAAASSGNPEVVDALLKHGAIYELNCFEATPLYAAATFRGPQVTELLLDCHRQGRIDILIDRQAKNGRTALYEACSLGRPAIAKFLLSANADYRITERDNTTPLHVSCYHGRFRLASAIVEKALKDLDRASFLTYLNTRRRSSKSFKHCCSQAALET